MVQKRFFIVRPNKILEHLIILFECSLWTFVIFRKFMLMISCWSKQKSFDIFLISYRYYFKPVVDKSFVDIFLPFQRFPISKFKQMISIHPNSFKYEKGKDKQSKPFSHAMIFCNTYHIVCLISYISQPEALRTNSIRK